jgi:hypothetical protein
VIVRFKHALFIISFCMANGSIGTLAMEIESRENEHLLSKRHISTNHGSKKFHLTEKRKNKSNETDRFRIKIDRIANKFENFDSLEPDQQKKLLEYATEANIGEWILKAQFSIHCGIEGFKVSEETWDKLRSIRKMQYERSKQNMQEGQNLPITQNTKSTRRQYPTDKSHQNKKRYGIF